MLYIFKAKHVLRSCEVGQMINYMYYVYLIRSIKNPAKTYIGFTNNIEERLQKHNKGASIYTSDFRPWKLISFISFDEESKALSFEKYIKSGSGYAFAKKRLW